MAADSREDDQPAEIGGQLAAATPARHRDGPQTTTAIDLGAPLKRLGLGAMLAAVGVVGLFVVTISHALTAAHNRLRAGEFIAVLASATVLVIVGVAYEWSHERMRVRAIEDREKRRDQAKAEERRRRHERLASVE